MKHTGYRDLTAITAADRRMEVRTHIPKGKTLRESWCGVPWHLIPRELDRTRGQGAWDNIGMIIDKRIVAALNIRRQGSGQQLDSGRPSETVECVLAQFNFTLVGLNIPDPVSMRALKGQ